MKFGLSMINVLDKQLSMKNKQVEKFVDFPSTLKANKLYVYDQLLVNVCQGIFILLIKRVLSFVCHCFNWTDKYNQRAVFKEVGLTNG